VGHFRVLLVEDETLIALYARDIIEDEGHEVVGVAQEARVAMELAAERKPNLALVDIDLKDGATGPSIGLELLRRHQIPVLFVTGSIASVPFAHPGVIGALAKPYSPQRLANALQYLSSHQPWEWTFAPAGLWVTN